MMILDLYGDVGATCKGRLGQPEEQSQPDKGRAHSAGAHALSVVESLGESSEVLSIVLRVVM